MELSELQIGQWYKVLLKGHKIPYYYTPLEIGLNRIIEAIFTCCSIAVNKSSISNTEFWKLGSKIEMGNIPKEIREKIEEKYLINQTNNNYQIY